MKMKSAGRYTTTSFNFIAQEFSISSSSSGYFPIRDYCFPLAYKVPSFTGNFNELSCLLKSLLIMIHLLLRLPGQWISSSMHVVDESKAIIFQFFIVKPKDLLLRLCVLLASIRLYEFNGYFPPLIL